VPPSLYYTSAHGAGGESKPLVIHCSDPRYQPHFQEFLETGLGLAHYALIAVPGGAHCLTLSDFLPKFAWAGWRWVKVMENVAQPERIILIAHDDCRWYVSMGFVSGAASLRERQVADLKTARKALAERFNSKVDLYYARLEGDHAVFENLSA
jgi:hypothetical protein